MKITRMGGVFRTLNATLRTQNDWLSVVGIGGRSLFSLYFYGSVCARDPQLGRKAGPEHARFLAIRDKGI
jgi:hypothetical protein